MLAFSQYVFLSIFIIIQSQSQTYSGPSSEFELMFATVGNNWPDFNDNMSEEGGEDEVESTKQPQRIIWNPIRRARNLIKRIL